MQVLIAHCDLKPQNILINTNPVVVKITDFGLSKMKGDADVSTTATKTAFQSMGTPRYINCLKLNCRLYPRIRVSL